jgi:hypothetical protein
MREEGDVRKLSSTFYPYMQFYSRHIRNLHYMRLNNGLESPVAYLRNSAYFGATDPRDEVYGILGLVNSQVNSFAVSPDYGKTVQKVFIDAI